jgi:hypothetical protein
MQGFRLNEGGPLAVVNSFLVNSGFAQGDPIVPWGGAGARSLTPAMAGRI